MPRNISVEVDSLKQLAAGVRYDGSQVLLNRVFARASSISQEIGEMLVKAFENTEVARSIRGNGTVDLQAHFGMSDSKANAFVDGMANLIRSSVGILSQGNGNNITLKIQAVEDNWNNYLHLPGAQYVSSPSNILIPVARWLLVDPNIDIGQAAYEIVFLGDNPSFDARIEKVARSRRAIMVSLESLGGSGGGYVLPSIISGTSGENFIEYALGQKGVAEKAAEILIKRVA